MEDTSHQLSTINYQLSTSTFLERRLFCALHGPMIFGLMGPWSIHPSSRSGDSVATRHGKDHCGCASVRCLRFLQSYRKYVNGTVNGYNMIQLYIYNLSTTDQLINYSINLSFYQSIHPSIHPSTHLFIDPSIRLSM